MAAPGTTLLARHGATRRDGVIVLVDGAADQDQPAPDWVLRWCRRSGRRLRREPSPPAAAAGDFTAIAGRVATISDIAAAAGRRGDVVLVALGPEPGRAGIPRVVAAVRDIAEDAAVLDAAVLTAAHRGAELVVAHGVPTSFAARSVGLGDAVESGRAMLDAAVATASAAVPGLRVQPWLVRAHPHELVGEGLDADLLVLGGPRGAHPGRLGLVVCSALHHAPCPVLLAPRTSRA